MNLSISYLLRFKYPGAFFCPHNYIGPLVAIDIPRKELHPRSRLAVNLVWDPVDLIQVVTIRQLLVCIEQNVTILPGLDGSNGHENIQTLSHCAVIL